MHDKVVGYSILVPWTEVIYQPQFLKLLKPVKLAFIQVRLVMKVF